MHNERCFVFFYFAVNQHHAHVVIFIFPWPQTIKNVKIIKECQSTQVILLLLYLISQMMDVKNIRPPRLAKLRAQGCVFVKVAKYKNALDHYKGTDTTGSGCDAPIRTRERPNCVCFFYSFQKVKYENSFSKQFAILNTSWPSRNGCYFPDAIFKYLFLNENI